MKVTKETIIRTIVFAVATMNEVLMFFGRERLAIAESDIAQLVSLLFFIGSAIVNWWKNNSFTQNALKADELLRELKKKAKGRSTQK